MKAGTSKANITPPVGLELSGWSFGPSVGIHDDLHTKVLALESGNDRAVIVTADLIGFSTEYADRIRSGIARKVGMGREFVLVSCSHTHSGPGTMKIRQWGAVDEMYVETVISHILGAADMALRSMAEARIGTATGVVEGVAVNRRKRELGPVDEQLGVMRIDDAQGTVRAVLMNYSCHPVAAHDWENLITADYPGYATRVIETIKGHGTTAMFTTGAAGDINPVAYHHIKLAEKYGNMIGAEALKVAEAIDTDDRLEIRAATRIVELPVRKLPSASELQGLITELRAKIARMQCAADTDPHKLSDERIRLEWAQEALQLLRGGHEADSLKMEIQVLRLNDTAFVAIPGELFVEIGLNIKASSPFPYTFIVELANGSVNYLPTRRAFSEGGYELDLASKVYGIYALTPDVQDIIERAAAELLGNV
jgi:neutral ceramidase